MVVLKLPECRYAECGRDECRYAKCRGAVFVVCPSIEFKKN
jgi:hypothetical protein